MLGDGDAQVSAHTQLHTPRRWSDAGRGLVALAGVAILVVGLPAALVAWVGWPLPTEVPSLSQIGDALRDTYIPDEFLVKALAVVCWLIWIELVASLLVEAVAYARGRKAGAVPFAGGLQRGAARLIATVALLGSLLATKGVSGSGGLGLRALVPPTSQQPLVTMAADERMEALLSGRVLRMFTPGATRARLEPGPQPVPASPPPRPTRSSAATRCGTSRSDTSAIPSAGRRSSASTKAGRNPTGAA